MTISRPGVFINCPFDAEYEKSFQAIVFAIWACGFKARCALEISDAAETRITKIERIIGDCRYGIHDISRTQLDEASQLPRFNMPLELGMFLGAKRFGDVEQRKKKALIFDSQAYRYQMFISDLAGMDIIAHEDQPERIIADVRHFLFSVSKRTSIPGPVQLVQRYRDFVGALPGLVELLDLEPDRIGFPDYERILMSWLSEV